ncbi:MAG: ABC-type transport auxiliary lipoprotein family protein [Fibrobacteria bacterium]
MTAKRAFSILISLATAATALALTSCGFFAKPQVTEYYVLDYLPTPPKERLEKGPFPYVARVRDCNIAEAYRRSQIVYRQSANQMQFYNLHLWAVDPERMVNDLEVKHLKAANLFENLTRSVENYVPDFLLSCDIQALEEYDNKSQWYAHMAIEYQLENAKTNQIVWKKLFDVRKTVPQQEPVFIVRELSSLLESINDRMVSDLEVVLDETKYNVLTRKDSVSADTLSRKARP